MDLTVDDLNSLRVYIEKIGISASRENKRNIQNLFIATQDDLFDAAFSIANHPDPHILLIGGFFIPNSTFPAAETDGPLGLAHLAKAFINSAITVSVLTDTNCVEIIRSALKAVNIEQFISIQQIPVDRKKDEHEKILDNIIDNWENEKPPVSHIISIERPGMAHDGNSYSMNGENISDFVVQMDKLFSATNKKVTRIAIGDGGNEIGMGKLSHKIISENIIYGSVIASVTSCDHLIVSGTSNWGCYALLASVALLSKSKQDSMLKDFSIRKDHDILLSMVNSGAVDGVTGINGMHIDGLTWDKSAKVLEEILEITNSAIIHTST